MLSTFKGKLEKIDPKSLVNKDEIDSKKKKIENFFLTMALIYNDLKGLRFFELNIQNNYEKPNTFFASPHLGEYGGLLIQLHKMYIGTIREFFEFIEKNREVLSLEEFKKILSRLTPETQKHWRILVDIAFKNDSNNINFTNILERIRHSVSFHYWDSGKNLRAGFIHRFFSDQKNNLNEFAYYSLDDTIDGSRFYFADASVEQFIFSTSHKISSTGDENSISINEDYRKKVSDALIEITVTLHKILKTYLKHK